MKRIFTLTALFVLALTASAQGYRKWDFTQWSAQTIANLQAEDAAGGVTEGSWSSTEKADGSNPQADKCYWSYASNVSDDGFLMANGSVIAETEGLVWNTAYTAKRSLAIAVDYPSTSLGDYSGPQYLWLGGGNAKSAGARIYCFIIPKVTVGQKIAITAESHKPADARGVGLYAGDCTNDANLIGEQFKPTTLDTHVWEEGWTLPEGVTPNEDGTVDIQVYNTNGCHIYSIEVGDQSQKTTIGYLYNESIDNDRAYQLLKDNERFVFEPIEAVTTLTLDDLSKYDALVISSTVNDAALAVLKDIEPFVPVLNLNPNLYAIWGCGEAVSVETVFATVEKPEHALFRNVELIDNPDEELVMLPLTEAESYRALTLAGRFADDAVLAKVYGVDAVAIHGHNLNHNGFLYLPYDQVTVGHGGNATLLNNGVQVVVNSKAKITQAPKPNIVLAYKDMNTIVSITSSLPNAQIFYTTDGSEPTENSTLYSEPFSISQEGITVKAVALGEGYLLSEVSEQLVDLRHQAAAPTFDLAKEDGKTTVTINCTVENSTIYYNYSGVANVNRSSKYEAPIVISRPKTIYAFAVAEGLVDSELALQDVTVNNPKVRLDIIAHMDANKDEYYEKSDKSKSTTGYFFTWGKTKTAYSFWNTEEGVNEETVTDSETGDEVMTKTYTVMNPEEEVDFGNGWMIRSRGQLVVWEGLTATENIGDESGRNPATVEDINADFPITNYFINLSEKNTVPSDGQGFPYNAYIVSTQTFKGPFDIVGNIGNGAGAESQQDIVFQVSKDGNQWESEWQTLGDTIKVVNGQRLYRNHIRSYEGEDEVYVRVYLADKNSKAQVYDIYIANAGEKTQELLGITTQKASVATTTVIYDLNGVRQQSLRRGINIVRNVDGTIKKVMVK